MAPNGLHALPSIVQVPPGIPVAAMAVGKDCSRNAALHSAWIVAIKYPDINKKVRNFVKNWRKGKD